MKIYKFGGASLKTARAVQKVADIVATQRTGPLLIVASAMGKTTNALEVLVDLAAKGMPYKTELQSVIDYHLDIMKGLFADGDNAYAVLNDQFQKLEVALTVKGDYDMVYDQVVSMGEVISTAILASYLKKHQETLWVDARKYVRTDSTFREGKVQWAETEKNIASLRSLLNSKVLVTQGFIGSDASGKTTTLGRDGSDYSAAVFASGLGAESVTIWKDVPGVMNGDPKKIDAALVFEELPFKEAAEMTYYGASVIHPKTIKPLANRNIPLYVKSFEDPSLAGTLIHECTVQQLPPLVVFKENQCLISCKVVDYTFVNEQQLSAIFDALARLDVRINLMQNSAISFSFCVDFREQKINKLIEELSKLFEVYYNTGLTLITIKNYDGKTYQSYRSKPGIILEQSSRSTLQLLVRQA